MLQHKKPAIRLFHGGAGSPLAVVVPLAEPKTAPKTGAERKRSFDQRRREQKSVDEMNARVTEILKDNPDDLGRFLADAPSKCGKLISGGYDSTKVDVIDGAHRTYAGRVRPQGGGSRDDNGKFSLGRKGMKYIESPTPRFVVKLDSGELDEALKELVSEYFEFIPAVKTVVDANGELVTEGRPEFHRCRLCRREFEWQRDLPGHIREFHPVLVRSFVKEQRKKGRRMEKLAKLQREKDDRKQREQSQREGLLEPGLGTTK
jgi:hypothetical protein